MPPAFAAIGAWVVKVGVGKVLFNLAMLAVSIGMNISQRRKMKRALAANRGIEDNLSNWISTNQAANLLVGETRTGGPILFIKTSGDKNKYWHMIINLAGHEVESIDEIWFDDKLVMNSENLITAFFKDLVVVKKFTGKDDQQADSWMIDNVPGWTSEHRLRGLACVYVRLEYNDDKLASVPTITANVKGLKCFDPRDNQTKWTDSPSLIAAQILTQFYKVKPEEIDYTSVAYAANIDEELVNIGNNQFQKRYGANGVLSTDASALDNINEIMNCNFGVSHYAGGLFRFYSGAFRMPTAVIDDNDYCELLSINTGKSRKELFNSAKAQYIEKEGNTYAPTDIIPVIDQTFIDEDGEEREMDLTFPLINNSRQARRLAKIHLLDNRVSQMKLSCKVNAGAMLIQPNDNINLTITRYNIINKTFRVLNANFNIMDMTVNLELQETDSTIFDWAEEAEDAPNLPPPPVIAVEERPVPIINNFQLIFNPDANRLAVPSFKINWTVPDVTFIAGYEIQIRKEFQEWEILGTTLATEYHHRTLLTIGQKYKFRIRSINILGNRSEWVESNFLTFQLKAPPEMAIFDTVSIALNTGTVSLSWFDSPDPFIEHYTIEKSTNSYGPWTFLGTTRNTFFTVPDFPLSFNDQIVYFRLRAMDTSYQYSQEDIASLAITGLGNLQNFTAIRPLTDFRPILTWDEPSFLKIDQHGIKIEYRDLEDNNPINTWQILSILSPGIKRFTDEALFNLRGSEIQEREYRIVLTNQGIEHGTALTAKINRNVWGAPTGVSVSHSANNLTVNWTPDNSYSHISLRFYDTMFIPLTQYNRTVPMSSGTFTLTTPPNQTRPALFILVTQGIFSGVWFIDGDEVQTNNVPAYQPAT